MLIKKSILFAVKSREGTGICAGYHLPEFTSRPEKSRYIARLSMCKFDFKYPLQSDVVPIKLISVSLSNADIFLARDDDGKIYLFTEEPLYEATGWVRRNYNSGIVLLEKNFNPCQIRRGSVRGFKIKLIQD